MYTSDEDESGAASVVACDCIRASAPAVTLAYALLAPLLSYGVGRACMCVRVRVRVYTAMPVLGLRVEVCTVPVPVLLDATAGFLSNTSRSMTAAAAARCRMSMILGALPLDVRVVAALPSSGGAGVGATVVPSSLLASA